MLTPDQTTQLKARLQADLARLADHAHSALDFTMDRDRDRIGRDSMDEATEEETYSTQLRLHDRETFLLGKIREAMVRLEAGEIDESEECSEPIGFKRLLARPVTTLCFECTTAREPVHAYERAEEGSAGKARRLVGAARVRAGNFPACATSGSIGSSGMPDGYTSTERLDHGGMAEVFRGVAESMEGFK